MLSPEHRRREEGARPTGPPPLVCLDLVERCREIDARERVRQNMLGTIRLPECPPPTRPCSSTAVSDRGQPMPSGIGTARRLGLKPTGRDRPPRATTELSLTPAGQCSRNGKHRPDRHEESALIGSDPFGTADPQDKQADPEHDGKSSEPLFHFNSIMRVWNHGPRRTHTWLRTSRSSIGCFLCGLQRVDARCIVRLSRQRSGSDE